jgi:uncharacterized protein YkwD
VALTRTITSLLALFALACGAHGSSTRTGSAPFTLAKDYASEPPRRPPANAELARAIEASSDARGRTLQRDPRLEQLADFIAARANSTAPPPARLLELAARQLGLFDPSFETLLVEASAKPDSPQLMAAVSRALAARAFTHYGAVIHERAGQRWASVVLTERRLALSPVPRALSVGTPIRLRGALPDGVSHARVELFTQGARAVVPLGSSLAFSAQLPTPKPGLYRLEIFADGALGDQVLAKLAIYVGIAPPRDIELPAHERDYDFAAIADRIFASINGEREAAGLPTLQRDARLDAVALQHSVDMRDHGFVGHRSPRGSEPKDRVARAHLSTSLVLETIARGGDPAALEAGPSVPAAELSNLLSREVTHVGIGVVALNDSPAATLVATELFTEQPTLLEPATATPQLLALVNAARVQRGAAVLPLDSGLCEVARHAAESWRKNPARSEQSVLADADRELGRFSLAYRRVNALLAVTPRLDEAAMLEPVLAADAGGLGIGIARAERDGNDVLAVVMVVGTRR